MTDEFCLKKQVVEAGHVLPGVRRVLRAREEPQVEGQALLLLGLRPTAPRSMRPGMSTLFFEFGGLL